MTRLQINKKICEGEVSLSGLIGVVSGLCTIAVSLLAVYAWLRRHAIITNIHDPMKPVRQDNLSALDIERAMKRMTEDVRLFQPNHIVGINRGGAIVGGWLAKQINGEPPILLVVNSDKPPGRRVKAQLDAKQLLNGRVYLVDDAQRKGEHMREAVNYLASRYNIVEIRRAVLLQMHVPHKGPESVAFRSTPTEFAGFVTHDASVVLPWDHN